MVCNDLSEMVLELKILFHDKVAIQQFNQYKLMKQEGFECKLIMVILIQLSYFIKLSYQIGFLI
jgi:hypothetical protein